MGQVNSWITIYYATKDKFINLSLIERFSVLKTWNFEFESEFKSESECDVVL